jgi:FK506-binding protein 1
MSISIEVKKPGDGMNYPKAGETVLIHYTACLKSGEIIDSTRTSGESSIFEFMVGVGDVIAGVEEAVKRMSLGERSNVLISSDFSYGKIGIPSLVPPNEPLLFDIELLAFH